MKPMLLSLLIVAAVSAQTPTAQTPGAATRRHSACREC